jgi:hypothetical protein
MPKKLGSLHRVIILNFKPFDRAMKRTNFLKANLKRKLKYEAIKLKFSYLKCMRVAKL